MKHYILLSTLIAMLVAMSSCTDEIVLPEGMVPISIEYKGELVDAFLNITVGELSVGVETRAGDEEEEEADSYDPYEDSEAERWVNDIWVFQYDASTEKVIADPKYLTITDQTTLTNVPVTLSDNDGDPSIVYVVANAGSDAEWGSSFATVSSLLGASLNTREPIFVTTETANGDLSIPMEGNSNVVTVKKSDVVTVPVTRMYAKIMIDPYVELTNSEIYSVGVGNIPLYCQVGSFYVSDDTPATYPADVQWVSRSFTTLLDDDTKPVNPDSDTNEFPDYGYRYIVYVPENIQGKKGDTNTTKLKQEDEAPSQALQVNIVISYTDDNGGVTNYPYTVYPGADIYTDYNIKRNNVYRVKVNIKKLSIARVPSANCFFAYAGTTISFFPYYRVEIGGGYDFGDYLYPTPGDGKTHTNSDNTTTTYAGAKIDHVGIVWQTKDCIGDNTNGNLVYLSTNSETHTGYEQIYVKANKEGNALIAAYDTEENIIWSWHIWVRAPGYSDPTNTSNAKLYYTYQWDEGGIYGYTEDTDGNPNGRTRVAGYEVMSCNLGALQDEPIYINNSFFGQHGNVDGGNNCPVFNDNDGIVRTFGMMYQWGRKDPFPPLTTTRGSFVGSGSGSSKMSSEGINTGYYIHDYSDEHTEQLYGNNNDTKVHKTSYDEKGPTYSGATKYDDYLFHSHVHDIESDGTGMRYSIAHPTVFLCGVSIAQTLKDAYTNENADWTNYVADLDNYIYKGGWSNEDEYDAQEWGSLDPSDSSKSLGLGITDDAGYEIYLYDDYGTNKSIFDPCPYGWRVSSGDLWLGFAKNGINLYDDPSHYGLSRANYVPDKSCLLGLTMYLGDASNNFRVGDTSWFPSQGFLLPDGCGYRVGGCGNYVNANVDSDPLQDNGYARAYITHLHDNASSFKVFETQLFYTVKSTGSPLRCIRDNM